MNHWRARLIVGGILGLSWACLAGADEPADRSREFLEFIRKQAAEAPERRDLGSRTLRARLDVRGWLHQPPKSKGEWVEQKRELRLFLQQAWGTFPATPCPLEARKVGEIKRDGYRIEKIVFQTRPGLWMTALAYVPERADRGEKVPAILAVHGHWRGAKQDPVLQMRSIGPAKLGYFVLAVDALGAGERGIGSALGEYHGEMTAATLFPVGMPLSGLQVYENMRAVDYLCTRPEVDPNRIGITGASGGGNQSMYAGAYDERIKAVVPVCSVGTYQSYLGPACCMCEVVPGALRYTEEWGILALTAPRGLMVVNATQDGIQFSVGEAKKSLAGASKVFELYGVPDHLRHAVFESKHDYNQAMRESMYGWMAKHLKGEGDGSPIPDPPMQTEDPESLRCFPAAERPADWLTIPQFAAREGHRILNDRMTEESQWLAQPGRAAANLRRVLGLGFEASARLNLRVVGPTEGSRRQTIEFQPEPGLTLTAVREMPAFEGIVAPIAIVIDCDGAAAAEAHPLTQALGKEGWSTVTMDLRATGKLSVPQDRIGRAPDHNSAEWSLWIGRPLLGQWEHDVTRLIDALIASDPSLTNDITVVGLGSSGSLVALTAAIFDQRIRDVTMVDPLVSYITETPYEGQRLGVMVPHILPQVGDVPHIASLCAQKRMIIVGGVTGDGKKIGPGELEKRFEHTKQAFRSGEGRLELFAEATPEEIAKRLGRTKR